MPTDQSSLPIMVRAQSYDRATAIRDADGSYSYADLLRASGVMAEALLGGTPDLLEARVAYLCRPGFRYVVSQWAVWRAGGVGVPLAISHPEAELAYALDHTGASIVVVDPDLRDRVDALAGARGIRLIESGVAPTRVATPLPRMGVDRRAIIFFTSGTTGRPKGVTWSHHTIQTQTSMLERAWGWTVDDTILCVLPLHHVHGVINVLITALWSGATCEIHAAFDPQATWAAVASGRITVLMAVPTIYVKLIAAWDEAPPEVQLRWSEDARRLRLMVSGSAALPVHVLARWEAITGHRLLERYGMTELGMAISNPLVGERVPGHVGQPLPQVEVRLVDDQLRDVSSGTPGEILVRGPGLFVEYWGDPEGTQAAFADGWFKTGDVAEVDAGGYRILGRNSMDIIKTGGFKVSALEIEEALIGHPSIVECAVVGVPDDAWGQRVGVALVPATGTTVTLPVIREWLRERLAPYKLPSRMVKLAELPRNAMGKVLKAELEPLLQDEVPAANHGDA